MGKGDKKSRRGKITIGSFGVSRPHKKRTAPAGSRESKKEDESNKK